MARAGETATAAEAGAGAGDPAASDSPMKAKAMRTAIREKMTKDLPLKTAIVFSSTSRENRNTQGRENTMS